MIRSRTLVSLFLLFLLSGSLSAHAETLAITHADFSTSAQGANGFYYGYYDGSDSTTHLFVSGAGQVESGMDGPRPMWRAISGSGLPNVVPFMQHPGPSSEGSKNAVRRYVVGSPGEPSFTGIVRVVGRYFDLNDGSTKVFVAVDPDGDAGGAARNLSLPSALPSTPLNGPAPVAFDFTTPVSADTTIDFGVLSDGEYYSDATGVVAWIVTEDVAVPTHVVANSYNSPQFSTGSGSQETRGLIFSLATDGVLSGADIGTFDTGPTAQQYTHAGLLYSENSGSGNVTKFNSVRMDVTTSGDFAELPHLFLLTHNSDPGSINPAQDERYVQLPVTAVRTAANSEGQPYYTFDLTSLPESQRTGYGFTVFGRGNAGSIAVSEIAADAERVSDASHTPAQPAWVERGGHRYAMSFTIGNWEQTETEAVSYGGHLVSINSAEENEWVFDAFGRGANTYIGLRQNPLQSNVEPRGGWTWMDGTVLNLANGDAVPGAYTNWYDGRFGGSEPNHAYGAGEDYATFAPSVFGGRSVWGDIKNAGFPETSNYRGIIELPTAASPSSERNHQITVSGQANIFGAGQVNPTPAVSAGTGGVPAPSMIVYGGEKVRITASSGSAYTGAESAGPDGSHHSQRRCDITGVAGISGYKNFNNSAHLVGVFVSDTPLATTPERLDFSTAAIGEAFTTLSPGLGQVFFIGDGITPGGKVQEFVAPAGATRLFIGMPDAYAGDNTYVYTGPPNGYSDNSGFWSVRLAVTPGPTPQVAAYDFRSTDGELTAFGGTGPYTWAVTSGTLPPHLQIDTDGSVTLSGQPRSNGSYTFTVQVTDAAAATGEREFTVVIEDPVPPAGGLVAWYPAENGVNEIISGRHASLRNGVTFGAAKVGRGFLFDGLDDHLEVADHDTLDLTGNLTIEAWVKATSNSGDRTIVSKRNGNDQDISYVLFIRHGVLFFATRTGGGSITELSSGAVVPDGQVHIAVTITDGSLKFYINGALVNTTTVPSRPATTGPMTIGATVTDANPSASPSSQWQGTIDELALYSRGLSDADIAAIHSAGTVGKERADAALHFSILANPNGDWSYREMEGATWAVSYNPANAALITLSEAGVIGGSIDQWRGGGSISRNVGPTLASEYAGGGNNKYWEPGELCLNPGSANRREVVRWTAPFAGRFAVSANFVGTEDGYTGPTYSDVHIWHNTTDLYYAAVRTARGNGHSYTGTIIAAAGDTVDFFVDSGYSTRHTGLSASVVSLGALPTIEGTEFPEDDGDPDTEWRLTITGGTGPYTVTVVDGELPEGLEISSTGVISGVFVNGAFNFTLRVENAAGLSSERTYSGTRQAAIAAPAGLAAWWPGQNTVAEIIGGDHAAAPDNNPQYTTGKVGRAFTFNGTSQSLQSTATDVMKHLPLTIEAWIKPEARTSGNVVPYLPTNVIANDRQNFGGHGFGAHLYPDGSMLRVGLEGVGAGEGNDFHIVPDVTFTDGQWVHVVVVYTEGNVKTYLDGELKDDFDFEQGELDGGDIIRIGRHNDDTGYGTMRFFQGAIDEVSLYHAELDADQVSELHLAGSGGKQRRDAGIEFFTGGEQDTGNIWTYGSIPGGSFDTSLFTLSATFATASDGIVYWAPSAGGVTALNPTGTTISELGGGGAWIRTLPQQIRQHPGSNRPNVIRWTAPAAGRYAVTGSFTGLDEAGVNTSCHVYHGSLPMTQLNGQGASATLASEYMGNGRSLTGVIDAEAGHTVDFIVSGDASYDSTGTFASVVYLGPPLTAPTTLAITTDLPAKIGRMWFFQTEFDGSAFVDPELRIQYAEANTPNDWYDLDVQDGTNRMTPPTGDNVWTMPAFLDLPVGNYRFRVVATAAGYEDNAGPAFGVEALGEPGTDPIPLSAPGQPPPPPPPQPMPAASKMTYSINGKSNATTAKQGQVAKFTITQPLPAGTPEPDIEVEWSTTPADDNSWEDLDNQDIVYNKTAKTWTVTTTHLPAANGVYFRTLTRGKTRLATPGPVVSNALKLAGPVNISPGALWRWVDVSYSSSSDTSGDTANTGDTITYKLEFKNEGAAPATNIEAVIQMPSSGVDFESSTDNVLPKTVGDVKKVIWKIASLAPDTELVRELTVRVRATAGTKITLPRSGVAVKCAEIPAPEQANLLGRASRKLIETMVFSSLRLRLEASELEDDNEPIGIAKMGQVIYYTLSAENRSASAVTNASANLSIPPGMTLEYVRLRDGNNDFAYSKLTNPGPSDNPSVTPHVYKGQQLIIWSLGDIPANTTRTMKFALRVMFDLPSTRIENGVYVTNSISIEDYNIYAKAGTKTIKAFVSKGAPVTALLTEERYTERAPNLVLTKTALADGQAFGSHSPVEAFLPNGQRNPQLLSTTLPGIGGVAAPHKGTRITYTLNWANKYYPPPPPGQSPPDYRPPASARNAVIHEEIPANTTFIGWLRLNDAPLASSLNITFRTKDGYEIPSGGETWTDTNGNGKADKGEYTDFNGNKRYDAFTDTRYIDYKLDELEAGEVGKLTYDVIATGEEGHPIVSRAEGAMIPAPVGGMYYKGYSIWCENRYQAGTATPEKLVSVISRPVEIVPPVITGETQADLQPGLGQRFKLEIGYGVKGVSNSTLQDYLLTVKVPKPFIVVPSAASPAPRTGMVNSALPIGTTFRALRGYHADQTTPSFRRGESAPTITSNATESTIVFKLGGLVGGQSGAVGLELQLPAELPKTLFDKEGFLKIKGYDIRAEMSHKKVGSIALRPASGMVVIEPAIVAAAPSPVAARSTQSVSIKSTSRLFLGRTYPLSVRPEDSFNMIVFFGNATNTLVQGGEVTMAIPPGLTLSYYSPVVYYYTGNNGPAGDHLFARYEFIKPANGVLKIQTLDMAPNTMAAALLTFDVAKDIDGNTIEDGSLTVVSQNTSARTAVRMCIGIQRDNFFANIYNAVLGPIFNALSDAVSRLLLRNDEHLINANSRYLSIVGADIVQLTNGAIVVPLKGSRVAAIGSVNHVHAQEGNELINDGVYKVTVAHRSVPDFKISGINTRLRTGEIWNPHDILSGIGSGGIADLVAAGGGNLVAAGGLNLIGNDGATLINNNTGAALAQISFRGASIVVAGNDLVAAGAGNLVAAGAGNLVGNDGASLIGNDGGTLIGLDGGSLIGNDGATLVGLDGGSFKMATTNLVAAGAGNIVAAGGGNMVAAGAGNLVAAGAGNISANTTASLISASASSVLAASKMAGAGLTENMVRSQFINPASTAGGILSHNGGQILSHNGGVLRAP